MDDMTKRGPKRKRPVDAATLTTTTCRLPAEMLAKLDAEAERIARENGGLLVNRSDVMRVLLQEALQARSSRHK